MNRIEFIKSLIAADKLDAFYISHLPNIRYLSGFSGSSALSLITPDKNYFFTDFRYKTQSAEQVKNFEIIVNYDNVEELKKILSDRNIKKIGFESTHLIYFSYEKLKTLGEGLELVPYNNKLEDVTQSKTKEELDNIRKAVAITDKVFDDMLSFVKPGITELEVSAEITYRHKKYGALKDSFDPIVASGWRGALPHGIASDKIIEKGDMVTLDFGCEYNGFCSDLTRTFAVGTPKDELKKIYQIVYDAQLKAIDAARAGVSSKSVDAIARDHIIQNGFGDNFGHGLGHGLGIEVHEMPSLGQRMDVELKENSVVTIEPGIYVEGLGGVRIEDDVVLHKDGCEVLNRSEKKLIII